MSLVPKNVRDEPMSPSALSIHFYAFYMLVVAVTMVGYPSLPLWILDAPDADPMWVRIAGSLVGFLAVYYLVLARNEVTVFFRVSARLRMLVPVVFGVFAWVGWFSPLLVLFAIPDLLGGLWTEWALRRGGSPAAVPLSVGEKVKRRPDVAITRAPDDRRDADYKRLHRIHRDEEALRVRSNDRLAELVVSRLSPRSAVDVGCGVGFLAASLESRGLEVTGVDGPWASRENYRGDVRHFRTVDIEQPLEIEGRFDVCCSIEVAEHLEPSRAESFVEDLISLSDLIVFSAAIPGQGGVGHKNEQWQDYWAAMFERRDYTCLDAFRPSLDEDPEIFPWFRQNVLVFAKNEHAVTEALRDCVIPAARTRRVLPEVHERIVRRAMAKA